MDKPNCPSFGHAWSRHEAQCAGGLDPAYNDPTTGSHVRTRCKWYAQCAAQTAAAQLQARPAQVQVQPPPPVVPQHMAPPVPKPGLNIPVHQPSHPPQVTVQPQQGQTLMVAPPVASTPFMVPMNYQVPGTQMPGYLTVPEPTVPGQHWVVRLLLNVLRSMTKAAGHTTANFIDHTPINPWPQQPQDPKDG